MFLLYTSEYTFSNGKNTLSAITTNKEKEQCDKKYHLTCIIHRGNFNGYTFLNMLLHMKTNQHSDVSRGLSKKILP